MIRGFHCVIRAALLWALCFGAVALLPAQQSTGTIVGVIEDGTGAVVPNATVTLTVASTGDSRQVKSNDRGEFSSPYMHIGEYTVTTEAAGFKKRVESGIVVQVDQTVTLRIVLEIGSVSDSVEVTGSAPLLDAATSSLGQVIENKKILDLPLNGRNAFALGLLAGNTTPMTGMGTNLPFVAGGGRFASNDVLLDGVDNNTSINAGSIGRNGIAYTPSVDAVEEFKVKTNNFSAEFGRSAGAIISATLRSGTNDFKGSAWEFVRNEKFDANNFFSNANKVARQPYKQNQFGFTLGGPAYVPKIYNGKNKTFFFFDYEATRRRTSATSSTLDIPPTAFRTGDFSTYTPRIYDPGARHLGPTGAVISTPFAGNIIPQSLLNKSSLAIVGLLPQPNAGAPNAQSRNFVRVAPHPFTNDQFDAKIDQRMGDKNTMFARFSWGHSDQPDPGNFDGFIGAGTSTVNKSINSVLSDTYLFRPTVVNELRGGYTRHDSSIYGTSPQGVGFANQNNIALFPFPVQAFPSITFNYSGQVNTTTEFTGLGGGDSNLAIENTFQVADNLSIIHGSHSFKMGGDFRRYRFENINGGGQLIFGSIFSSSSDAAGSGAPFADFLMGYPSGTQGGQLLDWSRQRDLYVGFYFQDDWKISPRLTLNVGVRYELYTQPVDARDRGGLFNMNTGKMALPGKDGFTRSIIDGDHNNWAPRLGLAYQASRKFTIRSGAGVFYSRRDQNQQVTQFGGGIPNTPLVVFPNVSASATITPPVTINTPLQLGSTDPNFSGFSAANPVSYLIRSADLHNNPCPYVFQWNYSMQYEVMRDLLLEAAYSGEKGTKMVSRINLNQIPLRVRHGRAHAAKRPALSLRQQFHRLRRGHQQQYLQRAERARGEEAARRAQPAGQLYLVEEPRIQRRRLERLEPERRHHLPAGQLQPGERTELRAAGRAQSDHSQRGLRTAVRARQAGTQSQRAAGSGVRRLADQRPLQQSERLRHRHPQFARCQQQPVVRHHQRAGRGSRPIDLPAQQGGGRLVQPGCLHRPRDHQQREGHSHYAVRQRRAPHRPRSGLHQPGLLPVQGVQDQGAPAGTVPCRGIQPDEHAHVLPAERHQCLAYDRQRVFRQADRLVGNRPAIAVRPEAALLERTTR